MHGLVLLMMGIMMPETCVDRSLIINIGLVASCWFISLHPTFHDAWSQNLKHSEMLCPWILPRENAEGNRDVEVLPVLS